MRQAFGILHSQDGVQAEDDAAQFGLAFEGVHGSEPVGEDGEHLVLLGDQLERDDDVVVEAHGEGLQDAGHVLLGGLFEAGFPSGDVELGEELAYDLVEECGAVHVFQEGL